MSNQPAKIRVFTKPVPPCEAHIGWCEVHIESVDGTLNEDQLRFVKENMPEVELTPYNQHLEGYRKNGGIFPYEETFMNINFVMDVPFGLYDAHGRVPEN